MRLGDLDALTEKLKNGLENAKNAGKENYAKIFEVFIDWVSREPTIDLVPVVRCRECRYYPTAKVNEKGFLICPASGMEITETDYCSYGERMDKEDET